jgi:hypothetical protein
MFRRHKLQTRAVAVAAPPSISTIIPPYATPTRSDMAVILVYFNPSSSVRIIQNLLTVKHGLDRAGIPYFIGELAHGAAPFLFAPADNIRQYRSDSLMFYKENLIRAVEATIPAAFTKLFLMDADILYEQPDWYDRVSAVLDTHTVCHPFQRAFPLNLNFTKDVRASIRSILVSPITGHPGYAWALRRDWFTRRQPSDYAVIGGGDRVLVAYVNSKPPPNMSTNHPLYDFLQTSIHAAPPTSATSCPLIVNHLNHGTFTNRQYSNRNAALQTCLNEISHGLQLRDALERRADGIFEWKSEYRARLNAHIAAFFATRSDDSSATGVIPADRSKFFPTEYAPPSTKDMAVILVYFNPANYKRIVQNILLVKHALDRAGIPTFIAELAHGATPFLFAPADTIFQVRAESYMFHKENLIRYAEARIPAAFTKICAMDADIFYDKPDWYDCVSAALDTKTVIQPFRTATWLDIDFTHLLTKPNAIDPSHSGHPGFVYAFNREFFRRFGLEDRCTTSTSGDTLLLNELVDRRSDDPYMSLFGVPHDKTGLQTGSCDINVYHLAHGSLAKRQYSDLKKSWLDIFGRLHITSINEVQLRREDGILEWKPEFRKDFNPRMLEYFKSREDDSS